MTSTMGRAARTEAAGQHHSPSPLRRLKLGPRTQSTTLSASRKDVQETAPLPGPLQPANVVRPQGSAPQNRLQHTFTAMHGEAVACLSGACAVMCYSSDKQDIRCGPRFRQLSCCALSPCSRYLACGEFSNHDGSAVASTQVLIIDVRSNTPLQPLRGHVRGTKLLAWSKQATKTFLLSVSFPDHRDEQLVLWSWPSGERLASVLCLAGTIGISFAPDACAFATGGTTDVRIWSVHVAAAHSMKLKTGASGCQLTARTLVADLAWTSLASLAWGSASWLYLLSRSGKLCARSISDPSAPPRCLDLERRANALIWADRLCGSRPGPLGLLACALAHGIVEVLSAEDFGVVARICLGESTCDTVGLSCSIGGEALWAMYSDRRLRCWRSLGQSHPDRELLPPVVELGFCGAGRSRTTLVTSSSAGLQHWDVIADGLRFTREAQQKNVTAMAVSDVLAATGHKDGELRLFGLPQLQRLDVQLPRHDDEVNSLDFSSVHFGTPIVLVSASLDRNVRVVRLDVDMHGGSAPSCVATVLFSSKPHAAVVEFAGLLRSGEESRVVALTSDRHIFYHDLDGVGIRQARQLAGTSRVAGACIHPKKPLLFVAFADRRILQLDFHGLVVQQTRIAGSDYELVPPLRLCDGPWDGGSILAVNLSPLLKKTSSLGASTSHLCNIDPASKYPSLNVHNNAPGRWAHSAGVANSCIGGASICLFDVVNGLHPLVRLVGHLKAPSSLTFLDSHRVVACWQDGSMFLWKPNMGAEQLPWGQPVVETSASTPAVQVKKVVASPRYATPTSKSTRQGVGARSPVSNQRGVTTSPRGRSHGSPSEQPPSTARCEVRLQSTSPSRDGPRRQWAPVSAIISARRSLSGGSATSGSAGASINLRNLQPVRSKTAVRRQSLDNVLQGLFPGKAECLPPWAHSNCNSSSASVPAVIARASMASGGVGLNHTDSISSLDSTHGSCAGPNPGGSSRPSCSGMGKWAHSSQVGSRVMSASDLFVAAVASSTSLDPITVPPLADIVQPASVERFVPEAVDVPLPTLAVPCDAVFLQGSAAAAAGSDTVSRSKHNQALHRQDERLQIHHGCTDRSSSRRVKIRLPPKPSSPPPGLEASAASLRERAVHTMPAAREHLMGLATPCRAVGRPAAAGPRGGVHPSSSMQGQGAEHDDRSLLLCEALRVLDEVQSPTGDAVTSTIQRLSTFRSKLRSFLEQRHPGASTSSRSSA